jgi:hypothetical protein
MQGPEFKPQYHKKKKRKKERKRKPTLAPQVSENSEFST